MLNLQSLSGGNGISQPAGAKENKSQMGQDDFLKLMITQLKNQDPLSPMQSGEFMAQIAQFTTASGVGELQKSFAQFQQNMMTDQALRSASLVGHDVIASSHKGYLPGDGPLNAVIEAPVPLNNLKVEIYTEGGVLVKTIDMGQQPAGDVMFSWDGRDAQGRAAPAGRYMIRATTQSDGQTYALDTLVAAKVTSVTLGNAGQPPMLNLLGLGEISLADVQQIR